MGDSALSYPLLDFYTAAGANCGTMTYSVSHSPQVSGLFFTDADNSYALETNSNSLVGTYTISVILTEDGCGSSLTDTLTVTVQCPCTLTSSIPTSFSYTYIIGSSSKSDNLNLFTATGANCGAVTHSLSHEPSTAGIFSVDNYGYSL